MKAVDEKHYSFVNLYPNINSNQSKFGTKDYKEYIDTFDKIFPAPYLSFDFYQLYKTYKPEKTFIHDIPTLAGLRLQTYVNLAYGAQGIEYWSFRGFGSPLDAQGKRTVVYDRLQKVSNEIQNLSGVFMGAKLIAVVQTGLNIPNETRRMGL